MDFTPFFEKNTIQSQFREKWKYEILGQIELKKHEDFDKLANNCEGFGIFLCLCTQNQTKMDERFFKRKLYDKMLQWKRERDGKTALLIKGARRVGKSTLAVLFEIF